MPSMAKVTQLQNKFNPQLKVNPQISPQGGCRLRSQKISLLGLPLLQKYYKEFFVCCVAWLSDLCVHSEFPSTSANLEIYISQGCDEVCPSNHSCHLCGNDCCFDLSLGMHHDCPHFLDTWNIVGIDCQHIHSHLHTLFADHHPSRILLCHTSISLHL